MSSNCVATFRIFIIFEKKVQTFELPLNFIFEGEPLCTTSLQFPSGLSDKPKQHETYN